MLAAIIPSAASATPGDTPYVALGDSLTYGYPYGASAPDKAFAGLLFGDYQTSLGADVLLNRGQPGATSSSLRSGGQLTTGLADINGPSDTVAVTLGIGGNDLLSGSCSGQWDNPAPCPFRANLTYTLTQVQAALDADPGSEPFTVVAYYNPYSGAGGSLESSTDRDLLGANLAIGCNDTGADVGLNDVIYQEAQKLSLPVANAYPAIKQAGQADISSDHLHPNDAGHAAVAQAFRDASTTCPSSPPKPDPGPDPGPGPQPGDTRAPQTKILAGPEGATRHTTARLRFRSDEGGSTFRCRLDGGPLARCSRTRTYRHLKPGRHTFRVFATDPAGNRDRTPAVRHWRVLKRTRR